MLRALQSMLRAPLRIRGPYVLRAFRKDNPAGHSMSRRKTDAASGSPAGSRLSSSTSTRPFSSIERSALMDAMRITGSNPSTSAFMRLRAEARKLRLKAVMHADAKLQ